MTFINMARQGMTFAYAIMAAIFILSTATVSARRNSDNFNAIDKCWRTDPNWRNQRHQLAKCSVGYTGKMTNNIGGDVVNYEVTDPSDNAVNPQPGTLRYAMTHVKGKVWITFKNDMTIALQKTLLLKSFTTIDGRGADVHIAGGACLMLHKVNNVIIHGIRIHDCKAQGAGQIMGLDGKIQEIAAVDADAIRMLTCSNIWIDHNTLYDCEDGLIDVTRGSTNITISNNWFRYQDKVMLLGHDDGYIRDKDMKVTVAFNYFGPECHQRMPRVRFGYAHVVNNMYNGWGLYAIGGNMNPSIKSQANLFIAANQGNKEVTWRKADGSTKEWNLKSVADVLENGATFKQSGEGGAITKPNYNKDQVFPVEAASRVKSLTKSAGALKCPKKSTC